MDRREYRKFVAYVLENSPLRKQDLRVNFRKLVFRGEGEKMEVRFYPEDDFHLISDVVGETLERSFLELEELTKLLSLKYDVQLIVERVWNHCVDHLL